MSALLGFFASIILSDPTGHILKAIPVSHTGTLDECRADIADVLGDNAEKVADAVAAGNTVQGYCFDLKGGVIAITVKPKKDESNDKRLTPEQSEKPRRAS